MVDEISEEGGGGGGSGGSVLKRFGPLAILVLIVQIIVAWAIITFYFKGGALDEGGEEFLPPATEITRDGQKQEREKLPYYYSSEKLQSMTANPAGTNASRFAMFSVQLGLVAYNRDKKPPDDDITDSLVPDDDTHVKLALYEHKIKEIIVHVVRLKTIDQLSAEFLPDVKDEIRQELNREVFQKIFAPEDNDNIEVEVQEVVFSDIIIQ